MNVKDKVFVVTGGGNGIGRQVVLSLLSKGGHVAALDINNAALKETSKLAGEKAKIWIHTFVISQKDK